MATYTNQLLVLVGGKIQKISASDDLAIGGSLTIGGNLTVDGDIISRGVVNLVVQDAFIDLAVGQSSTTAAPAGLAMTMKRLSTSTYTTVSFTAGVNAVSNPTIVVTGDASADIAADDLVEITGATPASNNGIYLVFSSVFGGVNTTLTLYGTGLNPVPGYMNFAQSQVTTATDAAATAFQPYITAFAAADGVQIQTNVPAAIALGKLAYAAGGTKASFNQNWEEIGAGGGGVTDLQGAYDGGNTIAMTAADGAFDVAPAFGETVGFSLDGSAASNVSVTGNNLTLSTITSGTLDVTSAGALDVDAVGQLQINSSTSTIDIGNDAVNQDINLGTAGNRKVTIGAAGGTSEVEINAGSGSVDINSDGVVTINGTGNSNFTIDTGNLDLQTTTSGSVLIDGVAGVEINSTNGALEIGNDANAFGINIGTGPAARTITIGNGTGATAVDIQTGSGGIDITALGASTFAVTGTLDIDASSTLSINSSGGVINVGDDAAAQAINVGTGAAARTITVGNTTGATQVVVNSGTGGVDVNSSGNVTIDGTGVSIDGTAASNFSVTNNNLSLSTLTSGAIDVTSAGILDIDSVAALQINSSTSTIQIGNDNVNQNIDLGTGGNRKVTIGATGGSTEVEINAGSGSVDINSGDGVTVDGVGISIDGTGASNFSVTGNSLTLSTITSGTLDVTSAGAMNVDAALALQINSSGGAIQIGNDAVAQNIDIGTGAAARKVTVGNSTGATEVEINAGTAGVDINAASGGAITIDTTAAGITLTTTTSGDVSLVAAGNVVLNAGASGHISVDDKAIFAAAGGIDQSVADNTDVGEVLYFDSSGVGQLSDANGATAAQEVNGVALQQNISGSPASRQVSTVFGTKVYVAFTSAPAAGDIAYLSETAGQATSTPPSASGSVVFRIGKVLSATPDGSGNYPVLFNPQYIANN